MSNEPITEPGIRGWLIVLTVLLFGAPGNFVAHAQSAAREFNSPIIRRLVDPANAVYDSRWSVFIFSETAAFIILALASFLLLWPLFFLRHRFFPAAVAGLAVAVASLLVVRAMLAAMIPTMASAHRASICLQAALWLPVALASAVYALRSRRVRLTFNRRLMFYPVFPFFTRV